LIRHGKVNLGNSENSNTVMHALDAVELVPRLGFRVPIPIELIAIKVIAVIPYLVIITF
jgi:hypothetical protein